MIPHKPGPWDSCNNLPCSGLHYCCLSWESLIALPRGGSCHTDAAARALCAALHTFSAPLRETGPVHAPPPALAAVVGNDPVIHSPSLWGLTHQNQPDYSQGTDATATATRRRMLRRDLLGLCPERSGEGVSDKLQ